MFTIFNKGNKRSNPKYGNREEKQEIKE